ncbi:MAG: CPBP family intramembrane glutamic endopeptidase [Ornithinimicrobium sp.]
MEARETDAVRPGFFDRGGFWKAAVIALIYVAVSFGAAKLAGALFSDAVDEGGAITSPKNVLIELIFPVGLATLAVIILAVTIGWWGQLFRAQPALTRGWWMWIVPILVLVFNGLSFASAEYSNYAIGTVVAVLALGLLVGLGEEVLARGLFVNSLRRAGYKEFWVAVLSSLLFAILHILSAQGKPLQTGAVLIVYTFFFGIAMYFTLRVTRNLIWPILLHATTDPSIILRTGGVDEVGVPGDDTVGLEQIAALGNVGVILIAFLLFWFIRGQVSRYREYGIGSA